MTYRDEFIAALARTTRLDCNPQTSAAWLRAQKSNTATEQVLAHLQATVVAHFPLVNNCINASILAAVVLKSDLNIDSRVTLGHYINAGRVECLNTEETYQSWKRNRVLGTVSVHAWLTLETGEILDVTLPSTEGKLYECPELHGAIILQQPESLKNMSYHPMVVGSDFLEKVFYTY